MTDKSLAGSRPSLSVADMVRLKKLVISHIDDKFDKNNLDNQAYRNLVMDNLQNMLGKSDLKLSPETIETILTSICNDLCGYGPIQPLLDDPDVSEVMVNGPDKVYVEKNGKVIKTDITFEDDDQVLKLIDRIILPLGKKVEPDNPTVDARLPDGSRVNAVIGPVALDGPSITIRKFSKEKLKAKDLIQFGALTENMADFLRSCVVSRLNIVISGGTGSGKTTLLNVLSGYIPEDERIVTLEDAAELQLQQEHVVRMETKNRNSDGSGEVSIRDLVHNALRMRPDRIIVGECRGGEALDMLQAMNTGHDGSLTTVHSNSPRDAISRLEVLIMMAGMELPIKVIRQQIASAVDLIVQQTRLRDGSRKVTAITEVAGMEGDTIVLTDIFKFEQTGLGVDGKVIGENKATGMRPHFGPRLEAAGFKLKPETFGTTIAEIFEKGRKK